MLRLENWRRARDERPRGWATWPTGALSGSFREGIDVLLSLVRLSFVRLQLQQRRRVSDVSRLSRLIWRGRSYQQRAPKNLSYINVQPIMLTVPRTALAQASKCPALKRTIKVKALPGALRRSFPPHECGAPTKGDGHATQSSRGAPPRAGFLANAKCREHTIRR
jgi:hypothetical protein